VTQGDSGDCSYSSNFPAMTTIGANGSAISSYLDSFGSAIASFGHPVIVTFAHEFNVSGQYPWAQNREHRRRPRLLHVGAGREHRRHDHRPDGTFSGLLGPVFFEIHALTSLRIFIAETDLAPLDGSGYESLKGFISDLCSNGGDGVLEFQDGTATMSSTQWSELDSALAGDCGSGSGGSGGGGGGSPSTSPSTSTSPSASPSSTAGGGGSGGCANAAPATAPSGFKPDVQGSHVVLSWNAVFTASEYEVMVTLPDGDE
jgi:hypothetical protein